MQDAARQNADATQAEGRDVDRQILRQLTLLVLGGLAATLVILLFLVVVAIQAVSSIDAEARDHDRLLVERAIVALPGDVDAISLKSIADRLDLDHARVTTLADVAASEVAVPIVPGTDRVVAWTPYLPGSHTFAIVAPLRISAGVVFALIVFAIGWRIHVVGRRLDSRRAAAAELAATDALTGLGNRLAFDEALKARLAAAQNGGPGFVLLLADVDNFKAVNDKLGHTAGDAVLQGVAAHLREVAQENDLIARIGGDEFAMLCSGTGLDDLIASLKEHMAAPVTIDGREVRVAASIGVARSDDFLGPPSKLTQAADAALYRAKRNGPGNAELAVPSPTRSRRHAA